MADNTSLAPNVNKKNLNPTLIKDAQQASLKGIKENSPRWWDLCQRWLAQDDDNDYKKLAFVEFNKMQMKLLPTDMKVGFDDGAAIGMIVLPQRQTAPVDLPDKAEKIININDNNNDQPTTSQR